jgi:hypothetical protein
VEHAFASAFYSKIKSRATLLFLYFCSRKPYRKSDWGRCSAGEVVNLFGMESECVSAAGGLCFTGVSRETPRSGVWTVRPFLLSRVPLDQDAGGPTVLQIE